MAQERQMQAIFEDSKRFKKIYDGWMAVFTPQDRGPQQLTNRRIVLQGKAIFLFNGDSGEGSTRSLVDAIILRRDIKVQSIALGNPPTGHGIEIESRTSSEQRKLTCFMFQTPNIRDYWKALILAMVQGAIPKDVTLLPGQVADILELVSQSVQSSAPETAAPSRNGRRPPIQHPIEQQMNPQFQEIHLDDQVYLLSRRQRILSKDMLEKELSEPFPSHVNTGLQYGGSMQPGRYNMSPGDETMEREFPRYSRSGTSGYSHPMQRLASYEDQGRDKTDWSYVNENNNKVHPFYRDPTWNREQPRWFIDCNRDIAETVLSIGHYGNLLMRPGTANPSTQMCYALSYRDDEKGNMHFAIIRHPGGFRIDVADKHPPMLCLSDVVQYFADAVRRNVKPLTCNNLNEILSRKSHETNSPRVNFTAERPSLTGSFSSLDIGHTMTNHQAAPQPSFSRQPMAMMPPTMSERSNYQRLTSHSESLAETQRTLRPLSKQSSSSSSGVYSPSSDQVASPRFPPPPPVFPSPTAEIASTVEEFSPNNIRKPTETEYLNPPHSNPTDTKSKTREMEQPVEDFQTELQRKLQNAKKKTNT